MTNEPIPPAPEQPSHPGGLLPDDYAPAWMQQEAAQFLVSYLEQYGSDRGAFKLDKGDGSNQPLPGVSLPIWLHTALNMLSGHPGLPYNHDRPALIRDLLFLGAAAYANVLTRYDGDHPDPALKFTMHIIRQEEAFRRELFVQELLLSFVEDLGIAAGMLTLKQQAGSRQAVFEQLERLFHFIQEIEDKTFWQPLLLKFMLRVPEIQDAMQFVGENDMFKYDKKYEGWQQMLGWAAEQDEQ